jgi:hypothetical protein
MCINNWNIIGDTRERRVFRIPVGDLNQDEVEKHIKELIERYKMDVIFDDDMFLPVNSNENHGTEIRDMWLNELESLTTTFADKAFKGEINTSEANRIKELIEELTLIN